MTQQEREDQVGLNFDLYEELLKEQHRNQYNGWSVVALFYASLHCVDMAIQRVCNSSKAENHYERNNLLRTLETLRPLNVPYRFLYDYSIRIRYEGQSITKTEAVNAYEKYRQIENTVKRIIQAKPG